MGPNGAPIAVVTRADVYRHHADCLKTDLFSTSEAASGPVGRPQLGEFEVVSTIGASRTIPVVDPTHWEATRATFRSRLFHRRRSPCTSRIIEMLGSIQRTRLRSHPTALCGCLRLYVGMCGPARQPQPTNWRHGLPDGKGHGRPSAMDRAWLDLGPTLMFLGVMSAEGPHFLPPRSRGTTRWVRTTPWAPPTAAAGMDGSDGRRMHIPGGGRGLRRRSLVLCC